METIKSVFTAYHFDVEVVTPVHVGMAQEKNYVRGLDYVLENGEAWVINTDQLFRILSRPDYSKELQELTLALAGGQADKSEKTLKSLLTVHPETPVQRLPIQGRPDDGTIRRMYRTGMGHYAIPGTSLKGAIRSIFLSELKTIAKQKNLPGTSRRNDELMTLMGSIDNNLMRFIQVGDVDFTKTPVVAVRRTKIFSADSVSKGNGERGEWKHGNTTFTGDGKHRPDFSSTGFTTFYETLPNNKLQLSPCLTIRIGSDLPHQLGRHAVGTNQENGKPNIPNYQNLLSGRSGEWLVKLIRAHTEQYLTREKVYFARFENDTLLNNPTPILKQLDELIRQNQDANSCLLRVGAGVGFHSITGDWQDRSQNHFSEWNASKNAIFAKTRKFVFQENQGDVDFALMGFIKLTLQTPESAAAREQKRLLIQQAAQSERLKAEQEATRREAQRLAQEVEVQRLAEERRVVQEAERRKPYDGKVKKGILVNAEVMAVSGAKVTLKLYVINHDNDQFQITYHGLTVGELLVVEVKDVSGKGKINTVGFRSRN